MLKKFHHTDDDLDLVKKFSKSRDQKILGLLFERYMALVYGVCLKYLKDREDAKDAVMEIYESMAHKLLNREIHNFKSWLYVTTKNHCLMKLRHSKSFKEIDDHLMEFEFVVHHDDDEDDMEENLKKLAKCIEELNPEQKTCINKFFLDKKSYKEISSLTSYNLNQVKSFVQNGKRNLKNCMEDQNE